MVNDKFVPQGDDEGLLTKESRENCIPSEAELDAYLATADDAVAAKLRSELDIGDFRHLGKIILYTENLIEAQRNLTRQERLDRPELEKKIELKLSCIVDSAHCNPTSISRLSNEFLALIPDEEGKNNNGK